MALRPYSTKPDGSLDTSKGFAFDRPQLVAYLQEVGKSPNKYEVEAQYIKEPGSKDHGIHQAVARILKLADHGTTFEMFDHEALNCLFDGVLLPLNTEFDILGWIMSVTKIAKPTKDSTDRNFYLPLLALYARWCRVISNKADNEMVHIAWHSKGEPQILLGSTIGKPVTGWTLFELADKALKSEKKPEWKEIDSAEDRSIAKAMIITRERQNYLQRVGLTAHSLGQEVKPSGEAGSGGFGTCAETFFFVYHATKNKDAHKTPGTEVRGLAMVPHTSHEHGDTQYSENVAAKSLKPPCAYSCQHLVKQCDAHWDWKTSFGVEDLQKECGL